MPFSFIPLNKLTLQRYPKTQDKTLRAWNAADELLIEFIHTELVELTSSTAKVPNCLIINDQFGALTVSLNHLSPAYWTDSFLSQQAIKHNLQNNFIGQSIDSKVKAKPFEKNSHTNNHFFDLVILRIPKHNSLLQFQLKQIRPWLSQQTKIIAAGMTKEIHKSNIKMFEDIIGKTTTSLAKKKARLIFTQFDKPDSFDKLKQPQIEFKSYYLPQYQINACGLAGVFSRDKLDIGTQVLLKYLPRIAQKDNVIDLGCGNGVIGAIIAKGQPDCQVLLSDESWLAVESAKLTFKNNQLNNASFIHTDVLQGVTKNHFDHILCNPPFHQQNVQTLDIAHNMFKQSAQSLKASGELRVVANRHLKYLPMLKCYFSEVSSISKDSKFTVWLAKNPKK